MTANSYSIIKKLLVLFLVVAGLYYAKDFLIPLSIGAVMATLFLPFCKWLEEKNIYRGFAVLICVLVLLIVITGIFALLGWQISELSSDIGLIKQRIIETSDRIQRYIFNQFGITVKKQTEIFKEEQPSVSGMMQVMVSSMTSIFTGFILLIVYIFCLLYYRNHIKQFLLKLSQASQKQEMEKVIYNVAQVSQHYLVGLSKMIVCLWVMYGIGFSIMGIKHALFFAFLCGLLEIIPFIGNIMGTMITLLVAAVNGASVPVLIGVMGTYGIVQFIQGWVLEPFIVGSQVKINPLFTIIALIIGELVWGIPGVFLAIPLMAMFKIVCDHIETLKPYGFLIGEIETKKSEFDLMKKIKKMYSK